MAGPIGTSIISAQVCGYVSSTPVGYMCRLSRRQGCGDSNGYYQLVLNCVYRRRRLEAFLEVISVRL